LFLIVSTSAIDCLERLVSEMTCYVSSGMLNPTHSLTVFKAFKNQSLNMTDRHTHTYTGRHDWANYHNKRHARL